MLHNLLSQYLKKVEIVVIALENTHIEHYVEEILTEYRINLQIKIRFADGNLLELNEAIILELEQIEYLNYRYHYQDKQNNMIFRYDNAPHFPNLSNFPHHKHLSNQVISSIKPLMTNVIQEANNYSG
ncbi:MAG: hypothetical protein KAH84_12400 [Thiomargarita sp.]|nr:hypothetical protein [Thiomargarita sp.]